MEGVSIGVCGEKGYERKKWKQVMERHLGAVRHLEQFRNWGSLGILNGLLKWLRLERRSKGIRKTSRPKRPGLLLLR